MAKDAANDLSYFIEVEVGREEDLGNIRHWSHLQVGFEGQSIWVKGLDQVQIDAKDIKKIPYVKRYYSKVAKLFRYGSKLPDRNVPSVLWTAINRGLALTMPKRNFNYFGVEERIRVALVTSENQQKAAAMLIELEVLEKHIIKTPAVRLQRLNWTILAHQKALLIGQPLLPIPGKAYWQKQDFLIPLGYDFDLEILSNIIHQQINENQKHWIIWNPDGTYFTIEKSQVTPLSIASFRLSNTSRDVSTFS